MTYQETISYLYKRLPMFSRIGAAAYKKDLTNTLALCAALGNPQTKFKSLHVAGTNGKGSVSHMLAAVLQQCGYKTGLYTSPHLKDFRERIKINGRFCEEDFIVDFVERIQPHIEAIEPSFFEVTVAMAFEYFSLQKIDIAIIETGLGGRLDSTNIITPQLSIITNIGYDHMNILGNTLEQIAYEKAGIIKQRIPVVVGEFLPETKHVFDETAMRNQSEITYAQEHFYVSDFQHNKLHLEVSVVNKKSDEHENYQLDLLGVYQVKNIVTAVAALRDMRKLNYALPYKKVQYALAHVKKLTGLHGRWETIHSNPNIITDVAHNEAGIQQLTEQIELMTYNQLHLIIGFVKDKEIDTILSLLPSTAQYYFTKAQIERALPERELMEKAKLKGLQGNAFSNVNIAMEEALTHAEKDDLIIICGSVFLVGEINENSLN